MSRNLLVQGRLSADYENNFHHFPTPLWATRALFEHVIDVPNDLIFEPCCGPLKAMCKVFEEYFCEYQESDLCFGDDYLKNTKTYPWVITNPPFGIATEMAEHAIKNTTKGVAFFVRLSFLTGQKRYEKLFKKYPPSIIAPFMQRVGLTSDKLDPKAGAGVDYVWLIWDHNSKITEYKMIPPCRKQLEKEGDWSE